MVQHFTAINNTIIQDIFFHIFKRIVEIQTDGFWKRCLFEFQREL